MNQKNGKNSLGLDSCFDDLANPIELFKKWFSKAEESEINDPNKRTIPRSPAFWKMLKSISSPNEVEIYERFSTKKFL